MALKKKKTKKKIIKRRSGTKKKLIRKKPAKKPASKKKPARKSAAKKKQPRRPIVKSQDKPIGIVTHYFPHVQAAVIKLKSPLSVGEKIRIKGHTTDLTQVIVSMQVDRVDISSAKPGQEIGVLVNSRVRQHDLVTKC